MAQYDTLPIYKATYDFLLRVMHAVSHFPCEYKYSLGERIQNECIELVIMIKNSIHVKLHPRKKLINKIGNGIDSVGYIIKLSRIKLRKKNED